MSKLGIFILGVLAGGLILFDANGIWQSRPLPLPQHLTIHGETWNVTQTDMFTFGLLGDTECQAHTILVQRGQAPADNAEVLVHESLHALTCLDGSEPQNWLYNNEEEKHPGIQWAAPALVDLWAENPQLATYVQHYGRTLTLVTALTAGGPGGEKPKSDDNPLAILLGGGKPDHDKAHEMQQTATLSQFGKVTHAGDLVAFRVGDTMHEGNYTVVIQDTQDVDANLTTHIDTPDDGSYYSVTAIVHASVRAGRLEFIVPPNLKNGAYYSVIAVQGQDDSLHYRVGSLGFWFKL